MYTVINQVYSNQLKYTVFNQVYSNQPLFLTVNKMWLFLVAKLLYNYLCPSVRLAVWPSGRPSGLGGKRDFLRL